MNDPRPPSFDRERMVKIRVAFPDDAPSFGESFHAQHVERDVFRVANLLTDSPFSLGDDVRCIAHPWGSLQVVEVLHRTRATTLQVIYGISASKSEHVTVIDAVHRVHVALIGRLESSGWTMQHQTGGWTTAAWDFGGASGPLTERLADLAIREQFARTLSDPEVRRAWEIVEEHEDAERVDPDLRGLFVGVTSHPTMPLGDVMGRIDTTPEDDPRLPPLAYAATSDNAMVAAASEELDGIGNPPGIGSARLLERIDRILAVDEETRADLAAGDRRRVVRTAAIAILMQDRLPIPVDWYAA